jgi:hypothetical protein
LGSAPIAALMPPRNAPYAPFLAWSSTARASPFPGERRPRPVRLSDKAFDGGSHSAIRRKFHAVRPL